MHTKKTTEGSPLFKVVWTFLTGWYVCVSFFLIVAGVAPTIEVFREEAQLRAAIVRGRGAVPVRDLAGAVPRRVGEAGRGHRSSARTTRTRRSSRRP